MTKLNLNSELMQLVQLVQKGKKKVYVARFRCNGMTTTKSLKTPNKQVALKQALVIAGQLAAGTFGNAKPPAMPGATAVTISAAVEQFLAEKRSVQQLSRKKIYKYEHDLKAFTKWCASSGATHLSALSVPCFRAFEAHHRKGHEPKTVHCTMTLIKSFSIWLGPRGQGLMSTEPFGSAKLPKPRPRPKYVPPKQHIDQIIANAAGEQQIQLRTLAMTGMRIGEMAHLRPQDVDLEAGWIHILIRPGWEPKTHQDRHIPIHPQLLPWLAKVGKANRTYFFGNPTGRAGTVLNDRRLLVYMQGIAEQLGIATKRQNTGIVIHSFRDYFETCAVNSGIPQFVVDAWMGHAGGLTQGQTYYGHTDVKSKEFIKKVMF